MISNLRELFAQEFMPDWKGYATVELEKSAGLSKEEDARRIDTLTRLLFETESEANADHAARDRAIQLLGDWLTENEDEASPTWIRLTLRHILFLHRMNRFGVALREIEKLERRDQRFARMPSFQCLWGNLLAHTGDRENARDHFEEATRLAGTWAEPHLENIENLIALRQFRVASAAAQDNLKIRGRNGRSQVLFRANLVVARCLDDASYRESDEMITDMHAARGVPVDYREGWRFASVYNVLVDSDLEESTKRDVIKWLRDLGAKIRPTNDADPDPITPFG